MPAGLRLLAIPQTPLITTGHGVSASRFQCHGLPKELGGRRCWHASCPTSTGTKTVGQGGLQVFGPAGPDANLPFEPGGWPGRDEGMQPRLLHSLHSAKTLMQELGCASNDLALSLHPWQQRDLYKVQSRIAVCSSPPHARSDADVRRQCGLWLPPGRWLSRETPRRSPRFERC